MRGTRFAECVGKRRRRERSSSALPRVTRWHHFAHGWPGLLVVSDAREFASRLQRSHTASPVDEHFLKSNFAGVCLLSPSRCDSRRAPRASCCGSPFFPVLELTRSLPISRRLLPRTSLVLLVSLGLGALHVAGACMVTADY